MLVTKLTAVLKARSAARARLEALRIERQQALQALQQIDKQETEDAEGEQRGGVLRPALLGLLVDADEFVSERFERAQDGVQERPFAFEQLGHERAKRLGERQNNQEVDHNLQNAVGGHG